MVVLAAAPALAQDHPLRGVALVIGQSDYSGLLPKLTNPKSDARAIDNLLGDLGFDVTRVLDGDGKKLSNEIADFEDAAKNADVALVYYSGHGIEAGGENYLVPIDADLSTPQKAGATLIPVSALLDELAKAVPVTIVLLDACRTNAFPAGTMIQPPGVATPVPAQEAGLAAVRGPTPVGNAGLPPSGLGMVIGFAASPGEPALDGEPGEENSPYAAALLKHLSAGGYSFGDVMTMVSEEVYLKTKAKQLPWVNSSLRRVLSFGTPIENPDPDETALRQGRRQLLLSIAAEPDATRSYVETVASAEGVPLDALYGMLKVLGVDTSGGSADLEKQLQQGARQLKAFKEQELGTASSDPELARLSDLANRAQDEGAMDLALKYREDATARARVLSGERDKLEEGLKADRLEIGKTFADHAQTAALNFDYATSAKMFGEAYGQVAKWDDDLALTYKWNEAGALRNHGDFKGDNDSLEQAIVAYQDALKLAPKETKLATYVSIENDLGWALYTLGDRQSDPARLKQSVAMLQAAIDDSPPTISPSDLAVSRLNLGNAVSSLGQRDTDQTRLNQAVAIYQQALASLPRSVDPYNWGKTQFNLASTLRLIGEREVGTDSLDKSIVAFKASLEEITRPLSPLEWSMAENNYATALFALGERRHDRDLLQQSADALNLSLEERHEDNVPLDWAMSESNLGNVYVAMSELAPGGDAKSLQAAVDAYSAGLRQITREKVPLLWATEQSNIGVAQTALWEVTHDKSHLEAGVAALQAALEVRTETVDAPGWAMTELNLSGALQELGQDEVYPDHLQQAVEAGQATLRVWDKDRPSLLWAKAHYAIANALQSLGDREQGTESYAQAIENYTLSLEGFPRATAPAEWLLSTKHYAETLQNMGERETDTAHLDAAVVAYRDALSAISLDSDPAEVGRLNYNLGLTLYNLGTRGETAAMDQSTAAYRTALTGYTRDKYPADWADTMYRIGFNLHAQASTPDGDPNEVREAITDYKAAQEIKTKASVPFDWAELENYVGMAEGLLGLKTHDKAMMQQGRDDIAAAWDVYKSRDDSYNADFQGRLAQFDAAIASTP